MDTKALPIDADLAEVMKLLNSGSKDIEALRRARDQADAIRREMRKKYGDRDIAVELVQKARDGES